MYITKSDAAKSSKRMERKWFQIAVKGVNAQIRFGSDVQKAIAYVSGGGVLNLDRRQIAKLKAHFQVS